MIAHTKSFKILKDETQSILDFAVACSYAVPYLKNAIAKEAKASARADYLTDKMPFRPDTFHDHSQIGKIQASCQRYKPEVSKLIRLGAFSYFEVYVGDLLGEILAFHGANELLDQMTVQFDPSGLTNDQVIARRQLQDYPYKDKELKYQKRFRQLDGLGVQFPFHGLVRAGLLQIRRRANGYKSSEIPGMIGDCLGFLMTEDQICKYDEIRESRNRIAHGRASVADKDVLLALSSTLFLRDVALQVDQHVVKNWLVVDPITIKYAAM